MKKFLLVFVLALCFGLMPKNVIAQTTTSFSAPLIWGSSPFQDSLWAIDTTNWQVVRRLGPTLVGFTITGMNGLALDPTTGLTYVIMKVSAVTGRVLGLIDLNTGVCTQIGNLGQNFSSITFDETGQLWGATGDGSTNSETLFKIDKTTGVTTLMYAMGNGADGEVLCYNRFDDHMYHWSGNGTIVMEKWPVNNVTYTPTNIPISGTPGGETFGMLYNAPTSFIVSNISSNLRRASTTGAYDAATLCNNPDDIRGPIMLPYFNTPVDSVCLGTAISITGGGHQLFDALYFHWGDGNSDSIAVVNGVLTNASHNYATPGTYTVAVETYNGFGGDTVYTVNITINPSPTVALGGFTTICSGSPVLLTANAPSGSFQWYMNGTMLVGDTTSTYLASAPGVYNMYCVNTFGCADSSASGIIVVAGTNPVVALGPDTSFCSMTMVDAGNAGSSYAWSTGDSTQMIMLMSSNTVSVIVTDALGCAGSDTLSVTINTPPTVNVGPDTTVCGSYMVDAGNPGSTYLWCDGSTTQTTTLVSSGTCFVMVTDTNGCSTNDTINAVINPNPVVTLGPDVSACTQVIITTDSSLAGGTFMWCDSTSGSSVLITNSTTCDLQYTDINGCMGYDTISITIYGNPTVTASAAPTSVCADDADVVLTGSPVGGSFTGTSVTGNAFDPSVGAGNYSIIYNFTDVNGCSGADTVSVAVSACVGIEETSTTGFTMFPNPTTGVLNFIMTENSTVEVFDVLGNTIAAKQFNTGNAQIDLSNQPNGVYFVRVNGTNAQRLVIQK